MYPHRIRLRGPWQVKPLAQIVHQGCGGAEIRKLNLPPPRFVNSPGLWKDSGLPDFAGVVRYHRHFGLPRMLHEQETVWLTCAGVADSCIVWLNADRLANVAISSVPFEIEVTGKLLDRNELWLDIHYDHPEGGGLCGDVALEIRALAWLRDLHVTLQQSGESAILHLEGIVMGRSDSPLDFFTILDRSTILQQTILSESIGAKFHFQSSEIPVDGLEHTLLVELVHGSNVWYTEEQTILLKKNFGIAE